MNRVIAPTNANGKKTEKDPDRMYMIDQVLARLIGINSMRGTRKQI